MPASAYAIAGQPDNVEKPLLQYSTYFLARKQSSGIQSG
jgi:hypothetical protein